MSTDTHYPPFSAREDRDRIGDILRLVTRMREDVKKIREDIEALRRERAK